MYVNGSYGIYGELGPEGHYSSVQPEYKELLSGGNVRRMSKPIKMGLYSALRALNMSGVTTPDAIIVGTGMGCLTDTERFLINMFEEQEEMLSPTPFIQSTHNTIAGQIALTVKCTGPNLTFSNGDTSFESGLIQGAIMLDRSREQHILIGGVDEINQASFDIYCQMGLGKHSTVSPGDANQSESPGAIMGEGAGFFCITGNKTSSSLAEILETRVLQNDSPNIAIEAANELLDKYEIRVNELEHLLLGNDGNPLHTPAYRQVQEAFNTAESSYFKNTCGQFSTAVSTGLCTAVDLLRNSDGRKFALLYNRLLNQQQSLLLVGNV